MSWRPATFAVLAASILPIPVSAASPLPKGIAACEEQLSKGPDREDAAHCLYELATGSGSHRAAAGRRLHELIEEHPGNPWFPIYLGKAKALESRPEELRAVEDLYSRGARLAVQRGMAEAEFSARWGLCRILRSAGRRAEEDAEVKRAVKAAQASGLPVLRLRSDILRALSGNARGEFDKSYQILERIRAAVEAEPSYFLHREYLFPLAVAARETGRFPEALQAWEQAAQRAAAAGDPAWQSQALYGMASVHQYQLQEVPDAEGREKVMKLANQALAAARASGNPSVEMEPLWLLGVLDDTDRWKELLERCYEVASDPGERSYCRSALARRLAHTDPRRAQAAIREALDLAKDSNKVQAKTASWSNHMRVSWEVNPPAKALEDSRAALDAIETLRNQQKGRAGQPGLFSTWAEHYYWLSGRLLQADQTERAFEVIERMRSRTLIDALGLADPRSRVSHQPDFASLEEIRAALAPNEAFLSFQVAPWKDHAGDFGGGSWLLVSTRDVPTRVHRLLDGRTELRAAVSTFIGMFPARDGSEAPFAAILHKKLLADALAELPLRIRRLTIVADDDLHRLPFAVLLPELDAAPLALRYEITLAPSATLWLHWRKTRPAPAVMPALVLAAPVTLAPLDELSYARIEGKAARRHLGRGKLLLEEDASEAYIKKSAGPFGLIHFAAHAVTDEVNPDRSRIHLSPGSEEDGDLQVREIVELPLDGRIVVLSTCESASGKTLRGEGVMGLARAFFQAGAHTVVASLWPLRDDDGAALFDRFYRHLSQGKSVAAALQAAQRDRMDDGAPAEAWAGVVVLGDGDRIPVPGGRRPEWMPWILGLIAVLVLAYTARRALQRRMTAA